MTSGWEYKYAYIPVPSVMQDIKMEEIDRLGREGWELVAVTRYGPMQSPLVAFLKRPLRAD